MRARVFRLRHEGMKDKYAITRRSCGPPRERPAPRIQSGPRLGFTDREVDTSGYYLTEVMVRVSSFKSATTVTFSPA
jgi:hypothetical protein